MAVDVEQAQVAGAGEQELERRDVPAVRPLDEHAARDERAAESAQLGARPGAQLTGNRNVRRALERAQALRRHRSRKAIDGAEIHPLRAE